MGTASAYERALILGFFAAVSALLCWLIPTPQYFVLWDTPLLPALWFGLVLCSGVALWASRSIFDLFAVLLASFVAWVAAFETTLHLNQNILEQIQSSSSSGIGAPAINYLTGMCGIIGGFVGSAIVICAVSAVLRSLLTSNSWALPILLGTVTGSFLELMVEPSQGGLPIHIGSVLPLFLAWQTSVAASIAFGVKPQLTYMPPPQRPQTLAPNTAPPAAASR